jgi:hypothetical protein
MGASSEKFSRIYLPYCIEQVEGIGHVVLNRLYKPLGIHTREHIDYVPYAVTLKDLGPALAAKLSWNGSPDLGHIWLYNGGCVPTDSATHWHAYQARLALLAKLKVG